MQRGHRPMAVFLMALALGLAVGVAGQAGPVVVASDPGTAHVESPAPVSFQVAPTTTARAAAQQPPPTTPAAIVPVAEQSTGATVPAQTRAAAGPPATGPVTTTTAGPPPTTTLATTTTLAPTTTLASSTTSTTAAPATTTTTTSTQPATTSTTLASSPLSVDEARALFARFFGEADVETALRVAQCESGLDPGAYNPTGPGYGGLFQHALTAWDTRAAAAGWPGTGVFDPVANSAVAAWLVSTGGWGHWPNC